MAMIELELHQQFWIECLNRMQENPAEFNRMSAEKTKRLCSKALRRIEALIEPLNLGNKKDYFVLVEMPGEDGRIYQEEVGALEVAETLRFLLASQMPHPYELFVAILAQAYHIIFALENDDRY